MKPHLRTLSLLKGINHSSVKPSPCSDDLEAAGGSEMRKSKANTLVTGISWWTPAQWDLIKSISADKDKLDDTYTDWMRNAQRTMRDLRQRGIVVRKVEVDVSEMVQWCMEQGKVLDGQARSEFVAKKVREQYGASGEKSERT